VIVTVALVLEAEIVSRTAGGDGDDDDVLSAVEMEGALITDIILLSPAADCFNVYFTKYLEKKKT
jgi:hypothetical protein